MPEPKSITHTSWTIPTSLLDEFNVLLAERGYTSMPEGLREAMRDYIHDFEKEVQVMTPAGNQTSVIITRFSIEIDAVPKKLLLIKQAFAGIIVASLEKATNSGTFFAIYIASGEGAEIRVLIDQLMALTGVQILKVDSFANL